MEATKTAAPAAAEQAKKKKKKNMVITPFDRGCCFEEPYKFILSQIERN